MGIYQAKYEICKAQRTVLFRLSLSFLLCLPVIFSQAALAAGSDRQSSHIGITKLASIGLKPGKTDLLVANILDSRPGKTDNRICFAASPGAPPHKVKLAHSGATHLTSVETSAKISYTASIRNRSMAERSLECGVLENELVIQVAPDDAALAGPGFYSDNLMLIIVIE